MNPGWQGRAERFHITVPESREITLQLPGHVPPGAVQVIVLFQEASQSLPESQAPVPADTVSPETPDDT